MAVRALLVVLLALLLLAPAGALAQQDLLLPGEEGAPAATTQSGPAAPEGALSEAAGALRSDMVWVDPDNNADVSSAEADQIRSAIRDAGGGIYVAVFDREAGQPAELGSAVANQVQWPGVYVVIAGLPSETSEGGRSIAAGTWGSTSGLARGEAASLADAAAGTSDDGGEILLSFVDRVATARDGGLTGGSDVEGSRTAAGVVLAVVVLGGGGLLLLRRRRARQEEQAQIEEVRAMADEDLVALGEDIRRLDLDIEMPGVDERAKEDYGRALDAHSQAIVALRQARRAEDFEPISHTLEEGRYAMESAKARLEGREPPEHRPPCFFDPRHGPSTRDVRWAPAWGEPRLVPACEADAIRVESGREPMAREIELAGYGRTPYWNAPAYYGPYAGGFFGGFGGTGLLTGMLAGSLLTSMWAAPLASADWGGGDFGGDWGGGDFGGGDWGGGGFGDFGGGGDF